MVTVKEKRCAKENCRKRALFGLQDTGIPIYCSEHAYEGLVDVLTKKCEADSCRTEPQYGMAGTR